MFLKRLLLLDLRRVLAIFPWSFFWSLFSAMCFLLGKMFGLRSYLTIAQAEQIPDATLGLGHGVEQVTGVRLDAIGPLGQSFVDIHVVGVVRQAQKRFEKSGRTLSDKLALVSRADPRRAARRFEEMDDLMNATGVILLVVHEPRPGRQQDAVERWAVAPWLRAAPMVRDPGPGRCDDGIKLGVAGLGQRLASEKLAKRRGKLQHHVDRVTPRNDALAQAFKDNFGKFLVGHDSPRTSDVRHAHQLAPGSTRPGRHAT